MPFNCDQTLIEKLLSLHEEIRADFPHLNRIAVALHDPKTDFLKTFIHSSDGPSPLNHYVAKLNDLKSLKEIAKDGKPRVINDLSVLAQVRKEHTQKLNLSGYRSSYTLPLYDNRNFIGFLFFNSFDTGFFTPEVIARLKPYACIVSLIISGELNSRRIIAAAANTARDITHFRDEETAGHLDRMAHYSRIIAINMADQHDLSDEFIEFLFQFAPLHDIGKVGIPDSILLKPGKLTPEEYAIMQTHVGKGISIINGIARNFGREIGQYAHILRNIVYYHHENIDGTGYPFGLSGEKIPLEARIVAVADVFDALTSNRPYKKPWEVGAAIDFCREMCGKKFDPQCVAALEASLECVIEIKQHFKESDFA